MQKRQVKQMYCPECQANKKFERHVTILDSGDFLFIFLTGGLWWVLRLVLRPSYRCFECGSKPK